MGLLLRQHEASPPIQHETQLEFRRVELDKRTISLVLSAFHSPGSAWQALTLPVGKARLHIGRDPYRCEIPVTENALSDIQALAHRIGENWYIVERGRHNLMEVNGFRYPQTMLKPGSACLLRFGRSSVLLRLAATHALNRDEPAPLPPQGPPEAGEYSLAMDGNLWRLPFNQTVIVGSDPLCDLRIPGEIPFVALLTPHAGRLYLLNLMPPGQTPVSADGLPATDPVPLRPGSVLKLGGFDAKLRLARELRFVSEIDASEITPTGRLRLLLLDPEGNPLQGYPLPPPGGAVDLGRSPEKAKIAIPEGVKISRRHAQIVTYENAALVLDINSLNGTYVNGERIQRRTAHPGDLISLANLNFLLCYDETAG
jgi:hypothetical protein